MSNSRGTKFVLASARSFLLFFLSFLLQVQHHSAHVRRLFAFESSDLSDLTYLKTKVDTLGREEKSANKIITVTSRYIFQLKEHNSNHHTIRTRNIR